MSDSYQHVVRGGLKLKGGGGLPVAGGVGKKKKKKSKGKDKEVSERRPSQAVRQARDVWSAPTTRAKTFSSPSRATTPGSTPVPASLASPSSPRSPYCAYVAATGGMWTRLATACLLLCHSNWVLQLPKTLD